VELAMWDVGSESQCRIRIRRAELNSQKKSFDNIKTGTLGNDLLTTQKMIRGLHSASLDSLAHLESTC
jgi:hypothetical protein